MPIEINQPNFLVVEGKEDELFFTAYIKHLRLQGIQVKGIGGITKLRDALKTLVISPNFHMITLAYGYV